MELAHNSSEETITWPYEALSIGARIVSKWCLAYCGDAVIWKQDDQLLAGQKLKQAKLNYRRPHAEFRSK